MAYSMATACVGMFMEVSSRTRATMLELGTPGIAIVEIAVRKLARRIQENNQIQSPFQRIESGNHILKTKTTLFMLATLTTTLTTTSYHLIPFDAI